MFTFDLKRARMTAATMDMPADAVDEPPVVVVRLRQIRRMFQSHHDAFVRREIAERHERAERRYEVGGDFSIVP